MLTYLLIEGDRTREAQALFTRDNDWRSDAFLLIEFSNVLATYLRAGALARVQAEKLLGEAESRMRGLLHSSQLRAFRVAEQFGVSAYDARFIATAQQLGTKLVTEDARLRAAAPAVTRSLAEAIE